MSTALSALWASIVRTLVPLVVGQVIAWATGLGVELDDEFGTLLGTALTVALSGVYYVVARVLEVYVSPRFGWLLGLAKSPDSYSSDTPGKHAAE